MAINKQITITSGGILKNADSVVLGSSDALYGIKKVTDGTIPVAYGATTLNPSTGIYTYDVSALIPDIEYIISWKITTGTNVQYITDIFTLTGSALYTVQTIFDLAVGDLIAKRQANGIIDQSKVAKWKALTPGILTAWQTEMAILLNVTVPDTLSSMTNGITITDKSTAHYYLASQLLLVEDPSSSSFYNQKFEENRNVRVRKQPAEEQLVTDVYSSSDSEGW